MIFPQVSLWLNALWLGVFFPTWKLTRVYNLLVYTHIHTHTCYGVFFSHFHFVNLWPCRDRHDKYSAWLKKKRFIICKEYIKLPREETLKLLNFSLYYDQLKHLRSAHHFVFQNYFITEFFLLPIPSHTRESWEQNSE